MRSIRKQTLQDRNQVQFSWSFCNRENCQSFIQSAEGSTEEIFAAMSKDIFKLSRFE